MFRPGFVNVIPVAVAGQSRKIIILCLVNNENNKLINIIYLAGNK